MTDPTPTADDLRDLASAAVALPGWTWLDGMLDAAGNRYQWRHVNRQVEACCEDAEGAARWTEPSPGSLPDLSDSATAGCLLALLGPEAYQVSLAHGTALACLSDHPVSAGPPLPMTLGAACVAVALRCGRWPGGGDL